MQTATLSYLFLPYFLFLLGWLQPWFSLPLCAGLLYALETVHRRSRHYEEPSGLGRKGLGNSGLLIILAWLALSGAGGVGFQNGDYQKHNLVLSLLITHPWPVLVGPGQPLVYYIAYYLPAALVGKMLGWYAANAFQFVWTFAGVYLVLSWIQRLTANRSPWVLVLFVFFSGLDTIGYWLVEHRLPILVSHIEFWAQNYQYSSNTTLLYWVPQHALAGWLLTSVVVDEYRRAQSLDALGLWCAAAILWSPFSLLGLLPLAAVHAVRARGRGLFSVANLAAVIVLLVGASFLNANLGHFVHRWNFPPTQTSFGQGLLRLVVFELLEFGLFAMLIFWIKFQRGERAFSPLEKVALVSLILIPLYLVGKYNDFVMRVSVPALFVLTLATATALFPRPERFGWARECLIFLLGMGALTAVHEMSRSMALFHLGPPPIEKLTSLTDLGPDASQYVGNSDSFFFRVLARSL